MNEMETQTGYDPMIPLLPAEKEVLGLPQDTEVPLSQAHLVVALARQNRRNFLDGQEPAAESRPGDFYQMYRLPIEHRIGAALTTSIIERVGPYVSPDAMQQLEAEAAGRANPLYPA